jgi:hypothetical protein
MMRQVFGSLAGYFFNVNESAQIKRFEPAWWKRYQFIDCSLYNSAGEERQRQPSRDLSP